MMAMVNSINAPHILIIGDIADADNYHVGDEAMVDANLTRLRSYIPNARFTLISQAPAYSAELYGANAIEPIGFTPMDANSNTANFARLEEVIHAAQLKASGYTLLDTAPSIIQMVETVHDADAVLISGGGNLSSTWPQHLFERVALIQIANILGKPIAVSGQTIGPNLEDEHAMLLARVLPLARRLGIRELDSFRLALLLGVSPEKVDYQIDDALHLPAEEPEDVIFEKPYAVVTMHAFATPDDEDRMLGALARQLERIVERTGLNLLFVPHVGQDATGGFFSDLRVGQKLAGLLNAPAQMTVLGIENARQVSWRTQHAALVISTRYHPLVFALAGGVPSIAIYTDEYTRIKLQGALDHANLQRWSMSLKASLSDALSEAVIELWEKREAISEHLKIYHSLWRILDDQYESQLLNALHLSPTLPREQPNTPVDLAEIASAKFNPHGAWRSILDTIIS